MGLCLIFCWRLYNTVARSQLEEDITHAWKVLQVGTSCTFCTSVYVPGPREKLVLTMWLLFQMSVTWEMRFYFWAGCLCSCSEQTWKTECSEVNLEVMESLSEAGDSSQCLENPCRIWSLNREVIILITARWGKTCNGLHTPHERLLLIKLHILICFNRLSH